MINLLKVQDIEQSKNSFYNAPKRSPTIEHLGASMIVKTVDHQVDINRIEEVILSTIADFKFMPYWLVEQWYNDFSITEVEPLIESWLLVGLQWIEQTGLGLFIRPTRLLLDLFNQEDKNYIEIPFGQLDHTCSEAQLMFDIFMGNEQSELWQVIKGEDILPTYHHLKLTSDDKGTIILREQQYRQNRYHTDQLLEGEKLIQEQIKQKERFTEEFSDFRLFPIITTIDGELKVKTPDLIIPIPRVDGLAKSYAIEVELTCKSGNKYLDIMKQYKDNNRFGKLFYLCRTKRIAKLVSDAYKSVGGLGVCELYILPFNPPSVRLKQYVKG